MKRISYFKRPYRGVFGSRARRRCPHSTIRAVGKPERELKGKKWELCCEDCGRFLDGRIGLAFKRLGEM